MSIQGFESVSLAKLREEAQCIMPVPHPVPADTLKAPAEMLAHMALLGGQQEPPGQESGDVPV